jgi:hypothetical protein
MQHIHHQWPHEKNKDVLRLAKCMYGHLVGQGLDDPLYTRMMWPCESGGSHRSSIGIKPLLLAHVKKSVLDPISLELLDHV